MQKYKLSVRSSLTSLQEVYTILRIFNRRNELNRLITWSERKRLKNPNRLYQNRLVDEDRKLLRYSIASPKLTSIARIVHVLNRLISAPPRYLPKGSARIYRYGLLTNSPKSHSILNRST